MRRRGFSRAKKRFRKGPRIEVGQLSTNFQVAITSDFTRDEPLQVALPLLSQWGLLTTSSDGELARSVVIDSSIRGVSVAWVYYDFDVVHVPQLNEEAGAVERNITEIADCLFVEDIAEDSLGSTATGFQPAVIPNLFSNQIGEDVLSSTAQTEQGGFTELFDFPDRVLYRRWGSLSSTSLNVGGFVLGDQARVALATAQSSSLKSQQPGSYSPRRVKRRCFLKDNQGLFCGVSLIGHNSGILNASIFLNAVVGYRVVR